VKTFALAQSAIFALHSSRTEGRRGTGFAWPIKLAPPPNKNNASARKNHGGKHKRLSRLCFPRTQTRPDPQRYGKQLYCFTKTNV